MYVILILFVCHPTPTLAAPSLSADAVWGGCHGLQKAFENRLRGYKCPDTCTLYCYIDLEILLWRPQDTAIKTSRYCYRDLEIHVS